VRRQVCRRVARRLRELDLPDVAAYRAHLESRPEEWPILDGLCRIPISRFFRDRGMWQALAREVLPALATGTRELRVWSAGCASGEEPYTLAILWQAELAGRFPEVRLHVVASDADPHLLERARLGIYGWSSLKEVPPTLRDVSFERGDHAFRLRESLRSGVDFVCQDIRRAQPDRSFQLVLCRNLAFTYFDDAGQREILGALAERTAPGGALVIGAHERLPADAAGFAPWLEARGIYRRSGP
jgi:chemotaxis protein methyltransferase CheR